MMTLGSVGWGLILRLLGVADRSQYTFEDCGIEFAWMECKRGVKGQSRDPVPQPRKVTFLGINSATILDLLSRTDSFGEKH